MRIFLVVLVLAIGCSSAASDGALFKVGQLQSTQATFSELWPDNTLAFTFDDGFELAGYTLQLARFLYGYKSDGGRSLPIPAIFFVNGCRFFNSQDPNHVPNPYGNCTGFGTAAEDEIVSAVAMGFDLGQHTYDHVSLIDSRVSYDERVNQLVAESQFLKQFQAGAFTFFRAPYLAWNPAQADAFNNDSRIQGLNLVGPVGADFIGAGATVSGKSVQGDWDCLSQGFSPQTCGQVYVDSILQKPNHSGIILIHDREQFVGASDKPQQMVEYILSQLPPGDGRESGPKTFHYISLGRMVGIPPVRIFAAQR